MSALIFIATALCIVAVFVILAPFAFDLLCPRVTPQTYEPDEHETLGIGATHDAATVTRGEG